MRRARIRRLPPQAPRRRCTQRQRHPTRRDPRGLGACVRPGRFQGIAFVQSDFYATRIAVVVEVAKTSEGFRPRDLRRPTIVHADMLCMRAFACCLFRGFLAFFCMPPLCGLLACDQSHAGL